MPRVAVEVERRRVGPREDRARLGVQRDEAARPRPVERVAVRGERGVESARGGRIRVDSGIEAQIASGDRGPFDGPDRQIAVLVALDPEAAAAAAERRVVLRLEP